jgi:hypothetical protein
MKLELKHLVPYLPYGLEIRSSEGSTKIMGYNVVNGEIIYQLDTNDDSGDFAFDDPIKPIFRPLSDLIKEIELGDKKIKPIHELAKIADVDTSDANYISINYNDVYGVRYNIENDDDEYTHQVFAFDNYLTFGIHKRRGGNDYNGDICHCPNQLELWHKLFEWHFDVWGLIEKGLAIDINTI